jgi:hypothetical protein
VNQTTKDSHPGLFLDYFMEGGRYGHLLKTRFGIRVRDGALWAVIKLADKPPTVLGKAHPIPISLETLPQFVRNLIDDHMREHPTCDLMDDLIGHKSFEAAYRPHAKAQGSGA